MPRVQFQRHWTDRPRPRRHPPLRRHPKSAHAIHGLPWASVYHGHLHDPVLHGRPWAALRNPVQRPCMARDRAQCGWCAAALRPPLLRSRGFGLAFFFLQKSPPLSLKSCLCASSWASLRTRLRPALCACASVRDGGSCVPQRRIQRRFPRANPTRIGRGTVSADGAEEGPRRSIGEVYVEHRKSIGNA